MSAVHYYRIFLPLSSIKAHATDFDVDIIRQAQLEARIKTFGGIAGQTFLGRDIMAISRLYSRKGLMDFVDVVHEHGSVIIFDTDDDLTDEFRGLGRGDEFVETIKAMDLVTVSTPFLADRLEPILGKRPTVLYNHIDFGLFSKTSMDAKKAYPGLVIGLVGTASHEDDWAFPMEALCRIAEEHEDVTILVAGFSPSYLDDYPNIEGLPAVSYNRYPAMVRQFDIVCCSLDPHDIFNKSKSSIKALESMSAVRRLSNGRLGGAVPVCTDMAVYRRTVSHMGNGLLTTNENWYEPLKELVDNRNLMNSLAVRGTKWVRKHRDVASGWKHWARVYRRIARRSHVG